MYKIQLSSDDVPTKWYNINADLPVELPAPKNSEGRDQISTLPDIFVGECLNQEFSTDRYISIPKEVREIYQQIGRPTPLYRATKLEEKLNTPAKIYYKREDTSPTGSHKLNSALAQAYYAREQGMGLFARAVMHETDHLDGLVYKRLVTEPPAGYSENAEEDE